MNDESPLGGNGKASNQDELTLTIPSRTTAIPFFKNLSEREIWVIFEIINFGNYFQERELFSVNGGGSLVYRMELAAIFLATVFKNAAIILEERQNPKDDPKEIILNLVDLVVQRARELQEQHNA